GLSRQGTVESTAIRTILRPDNRLDRSNRIEQIRRNHPLVRGIVMNLSLRCRKVLVTLAAGILVVGNGCTCGTKPTRSLTSGRDKQDVNVPFDEKENKVALVVGVNDYREVRKLHGCTNDAKNIRELLVTRYGFPPGNVKVLTDGDATREGILKA